jgi:hypothetical protein
MSEPTNDLSDTLDTFFSACMVLANHLAPFEAEEAEGIGEAGANYLNTIAWDQAGKAHDSAGAAIQVVPRDAFEVEELYHLTDLALWFLADANANVQARTVRGLRALLIRTVNRAADATLSGKGEAA